MKRPIRVVSLIMLCGMTPIAIAQDAASGGGPSSTNGFADAFKTDWSKDFSVSVGAKVWVNEWTTWAINDDVSSFFDVNGNEVLDRGDVVDAVSPSNITSHTSDSYEAVAIPSASIKWKNIFASASYFARNEYGFETLDGGDRYEWDVNAGYYVLPPYLALTAGYKNIHQEFGTVDLDINGPVLGFVGAVPMKWGFSLYSSFAYGFLEAESDNSDLFLESGQRGDRESRYWLVETGVAYTHDLKDLPVHLLLNSATVYAGYRHQQVETEGVLSDNPDTTTRNESKNDALDTTRGFVVGVNFAF